MPRALLEATPLEDQLARDRALATHGSFLVQAPAGSGKTDLLTLRFLHLLAAVDDPQEILAITFTRAATAEMRGRVIEALQEAQAASENDGENTAQVSPRMQAARAALRNSAARGWKLLEQPQQLNVMTIDSLCLAIAQETPLLSRLGGSLTPVEDAEPLYLLAARRTLARLGGSFPDLSAAIRSLLELRETSLADCERLIADMLGRRDQWGHALPLAAADTDDPDWLAVQARMEAPFRRERQQAIAKALVLFAERPHILYTLLHLAGTACANLEREGSEARWKALGEVDLLEGPAEQRHWACLCEFLLTGKNLWRKSVTVKEGFPAGAAGRAEKDRFRRLVDELSEHPEAIEILCRLRSLPPEGYSPQQWLLLQHILTILRHAAAELRLVFAERGVVDFVELGLAAREVLRDEQGAPSEAAERISSRWPHLLVDEFQDTSRAQYELLALLAAGRETAAPSTLFLVGDPMQSIYGFRQAEVELFESTRRHGLGEARDAPPLEALELVMNFRSHAGLTAPLEKVFSKVFSQNRGGNGSGGYVVGFAPSVASRSAPAGMEESVHVTAQFLPPKAGPGEKTAACQAEAAQVLAVIERHAPEMEAAKREDRPFRIAVLVRAKKHLHEIVRRLREAAIPFRAIEIEELSARQEVLDLKALACALMQPMDRIAWLTVLRAPWCGLTLRDLHALCGHDDPALAEASVLELLRTRISLLSPDGQQRASRTAAVLEEAMREKHRQISFSRWLERTWWTLGGRECLDPAGHENARAFFRMFDELPPYGAQLDRRLNRIFAQPDPRASERNGVQLMTIHKAKGLEFEVVIVPGLEHKAATDSQALLCWLERTSLQQAEETERRELLVAPIGRKGDRDPLYRWVGRQKELREAEEAKRLLYVAATRASRELHLIGTATVKSAGTIEPGGGKSLLSTAWPALAENFAAAWRNRSPEPLAGPEPAAALAANKDEVPKKIALRRLPSNWRPAKSKATAKVPISGAELSSGERAGDPFGRPPVERPLGSLAARATGLAVHALFEEAAQRGGDGQDLLHETGSWRPRAIALLRHAGISKAEAEQSAGKVIQALQSALGDEIGRWILTRTEAQTESSWSTWREPAGETYGTMLDTVRADRIFRAGAEPVSQGNTHIWIVDYKTAHPGSGQVDDFLASEREKYRPQLSSYAEIQRKVHGETIELRLALYYPLLKRLVWWAA